MATSNTSILFTLRSKLNEKMFSACQALKVYLNGINLDGTTLSSKELVCIVYLSVRASEGHCVHI